MSIITPEEVRKISALARLSLTDDEVSSATRDLSGILNHFSAIGNINTADVPAADAVSGLSNISRQDVAQPNMLCTPEDLLARAPKTKQGYVQVPGVFEESSVS